MKKHIRILFLYGATLFVSEIWKQWSLTFFVNHGHYDWWYFPFQLCSIPMYLCLLLPVVTEKIRQVFLTYLSTFGLLAGAFTFFDISGLFYSYMPLTIHSFVWHIAMIGIGIYAGCHIPHLSSRLFSGASLCYVFCCLLATFFNLILFSYGDINMFYISPYYPMRQKVFCLIADTVGNTFGIFFYISAIWFGAFLLSLFWKIRNKHCKTF